MTSGGTTYLFDTYMCLELITNQPEAVAAKLAGRFLGDVKLSALTYARLTAWVLEQPANTFGLEMLALESLTEYFPVVSFDTAAAKTYGAMVLPGAQDDHHTNLLASHALALDATLVTPRPEHYAGIDGLRIENWFQA